MNAIETRGLTKRFGKKTAVDQLSLSVQEKDAPLMQLSLSLPSYDMAAQMAKSWPGKASAFYASAIGMLSEEET